jgi:hypothetical protein
MSKPAVPKSRLTIAPIVIGWREWVALPLLSVARIKAKVDTGARTSALHAIDIRYVERQGRTWVAFAVHPRQRDAKKIVHCEAPLIERRFVTDSGGKRTLRPVISTVVEVDGRAFEVELTLIARDDMGFRMLVGRQAIRGRFLVDPGRSYLAAKPPLRTARKKPRRAKKKKAAATPKKAKDAP